MSLKQIGSKDQSKVQVRGEPEEEKKTKIEQNRIKDIETTEGFMKCLFPSRMVLKLLKRKTWE